MVRPDRWADGPMDEVTALVEAGLRAMRLVATALLLPYILRYRPGPDAVDLPFDTWISAVFLCGTLALMNGLSLVAQKVPSGRIRLAISVSAVIVDSVVVLLVISILSVLDPNLAWFVFIIPVLEAGMRFGVRPAVFTWFGLFGANVGASIWNDNLGSLFDHLDLVMQRLGIVLLVAIPTIYLSQKLLLDIRIERRATGEATTRSRLLETVAQSSQRVTRLDAGMVDELLESVSQLGFDVVDVCVLGVRGQWRIEATRQREPGITLPDPAKPEGGLVNLGHDTVVVHGTLGPDVENALRRQGLSSLIACPLGGRDDATVVLRCGHKLGTQLTSTQVECVELIAGNATIALHNKRLVGELRAMQQRLHHQAYHDALTGLSNRMYFTEQLDQAFNSTRGSGTECAVMFIDLDRFKPVNDSLGHDVGNELLINVARRLMGAVRQDDLVARMGGDEFVVLLRDVYGSTHDNDIAEIADRVCQAISDPFIVSANEIVISCSVGIAISGPEVGDSTELVRRADLAMYRAKGLGKARWERYRADIDEEGLSKIRIETDLRRAVTNNQVGVGFQGILSVRTGQLIGAETLLRWEHPTQGVISPEILVPIAEDSGLILELGRRILERACLQAADWQQRFPEQPPMIAVNVSPVQLFHPRFFETLDSVLERTGVDPTWIIAEITENIVSIGTDSGQKLRDLKARGVRLALDDFGKGQTSLAYLHEFPIDILKVEKTFVQNAGVDRANNAILESIIRLAHELGLVVIAEGVETKAHLQRLRELDCDLAQGYWLHRPGHPAELTRRIKEQRSRLAHTI